MLWLKQFLLHSGEQSYSLALSTVSTCALISYLLWFFLITSPTHVLIFSCISGHQCVYLHLASEGLWSGNSIYLRRGFWHQPLVPRTNARLFKVQWRLILPFFLPALQWFNCGFSEYSFWNLLFFQHYTLCLNDYTYGWLKCLLLKKYIRHGTAIRKCRVL